ncbi:MAG TPA: hypothetical protein VFU50_20905 [Terriglobales bacterium]|nr:hypothetical protein [Terriglobales bacterium]
MKLSTKLEVAANVATIVLASVACFVFIRGSFNSPPRAAQSSLARTQSQVGANLAHSSLPVDWRANDRTLILGMQTTCHFCTDSAPFFKRLSAAASGNVKLVAVLPQTVNDSRAYLTKLGVHVDDVVQEQLSTVGISGTPTLLLVDKNGVVKNVWVGKLPPEREAEVLSVIQNRADSKKAKMTMFKHSPIG